jgi:hypothetical protein
MGIFYDIVAITNLKGPVPILKSSNISYNFMVHLDKLPVNTTNSRIMRTRNSFMFTDFPRERRKRTSLSTGPYHTVFQDKSQLQMLLVFQDLVLTHLDRQEVQVPPYIPKYGAHSHRSSIPSCLLPFSHEANSGNYDFSAWLSAHLGQGWLVICPGLEGTFLVYPYSLPLTHKSNTVWKINH